MKNIFQGLYRGGLVQEKIHICECLKIIIVGLSMYQTKSIAFTILILFVNLCT